MRLNTARGDGFEVRERCLPVSLIVPGRHSTWTQREKGRGEKERVCLGQIDTMQPDFFIATHQTRTLAAIQSLSLSLYHTHAHIKSPAINYVALLACRLTSIANQMQTEYSNHTGAECADLCKTPAVTRGHIHSTFQKILEKIRGHMSGHGLG